MCVCVIIAIVFSCSASLSHFCWADEGLKIYRLDEAYSLALKNQKQIQIARIEVEKSMGMQKKALTIMTPRIKVNGSYSRLDDQIDFEIQLGNIKLPPIQTVPEDQTVGNLEIVQPIYLGQFLPSRKKAKQAVQSSKEGYSETIQSVLFKVAQAYYEVLKRERLVQNARDTLKLVEEELRVSRSKFSAGAVTEDAVLRAELEISRSKSKIIKNLNTLQLAKDVLKRLMCVEGQDVGVVEPAELVEEEMSYEEMLRRAFENRPDYRQALVAVKMAETDVESVHAKFHPRLGASWDYYKVSEPAWNQEDNYWVAFLKLEIPLFEGGQRYYDLKEKKESLMQARLAVDDLRQNIEVDVKGALLSLQTGKSILENSVSQMKLAQMNYDIIFSKYRYGAATFSDLAEARSYLDTAKTDLITNTLDRQVSILNVQKVIGELVRWFIDKNEDENAAFEELQDGGISADMGREKGFWTSDEN